MTLLTLAAMLAWVRAHASVAAACAVPLCVLAGARLQGICGGVPVADRARRVRVAVAAGARRAVAFDRRVLRVRRAVFRNARTSVRRHLARVSDQRRDVAGERFRHAIASLLPWWRGLSRSAPAAGTAYVVALAIAMATVLLATRGGQRLLAAALFMASVGLCAATLMNLGGMNPSGEGGRLAYSPFAWLALALGVGSAATAAGRRDPPTRVFGLALLAAATITGTWVLERELRFARAVQRDVQALAMAAREWALAHPGLTLLFIDGQRGAVVAGRNAQGGLVLPPIQPEPLLHRILPTLPAEIELRYDQLDAGLATRLADLRPSYVDARVLKQLAERDSARWPEHYACWSSRERRIVAFPAPDPAQRSAWASAIRAAIAQCDSQ